MSGQTVFPDGGTQYVVIEQPDGSVTVLRRTNARGTSLGSVRIPADLRVQIGMLIAAARSHGAAERAGEEAE